jgi:deoxyribodipyrimidine photo-lyase
MCPPPFYVNQLLRVDGALMVGAMSVLLLFRQDLRLEDNPALDHALATKAPILPLYVDTREGEGEDAVCGAAAVFTHHALLALRASLKARLGLELQILRSKNLSESLAQVSSALGIEKAFWNRRYDPLGIEADKKLKLRLESAGLEVQSFKGSLLWEPWEVLQESGKPYQVFSPFYKRALKASYPAAVRKLKDRAVPAMKVPASLRVEDLKLLPPKKLKWDELMLSHWPEGVSEEGALKRLRDFIRQGLATYDETRNIPSLKGSSRLSPYLRHGLLGPRQIWQEIGKAPASKGREIFEKELVWREFAYHLLFYFPHTVSEPLRPDFADFPWEKNPKALQAWQKGRTGFPIVDAGMRELWETGWMHNRVRMIVASFLVKDLRLSWREGARYFWETLVDADLANNSLGWQWSAGCGADAAPYFRVLNPRTQSENFDAGGDYIRRWVPEIAALPDKYLHAPETAPAQILAEAKIELGKTYPRPLVDHKKAREQALAAFAKIKKKS